MVWNEMFLDYHTNLYMFHGEIVTVVRIWNVIFDPCVKPHFGAIVY